MKGGGPLFCSLIARFVVCSLARSLARWLAGSQWCSGATVRGAARCGAVQLVRQTVAMEENQRDVADVEKLQAFRNKHKGERCVIVGNGPSLNEMDLTPLANETTFAVNGKTCVHGFFTGLRSDFCSGWMSSRMHTCIVLRKWSTSCASMNVFLLPL